MKIGLVWRDFGTGLYRWVAYWKPFSETMSAHHGQSFAGVIEAMRKTYQKHYAS
jgi:hypothetical protein